jgi:hypothetical protein
MTEEPRAPQDDPPKNPLHRGHSNLTSADLERIAENAMSSENDLQHRVEHLEGDKTWIAILLMVIAALLVMIWAR